MDDFGSFGGGVWDVVGCFVRGGGGKKLLVSAYSISFLFYPHYFFLNIF